MTRRPLPTSIGLATLGLLALPLYAVQRLPWRDPMGPAAAWTTLGVYVAIAAAGMSGPVDDLVARLRERSCFARVEGGGAALGDARHFDEAADAVLALRAENARLQEAAGKAYALLWRSIPHDPAVREARHILLASLTPEEQRSAIAWVIATLGEMSTSELISADMRAGVFPRRSYDPDAITGDPA